MTFCWHKYRYSDSTERLVKKLPTGRLFETTYFDKCIKCGKVKESWVHSKNWYWGETKTLKEGHAETMQTLAEINERLKAEVKKL